jgi:hypothetical protein
MANRWVSVLSEVNPNPTPDGGMQTNAAAWGVPVDEVAALDAQASVCFDLLNKVKDPETATRVIRKRCAAAFVLLEKKMRELHTYFYTAKFPEVELYRLGLLPHGEGGEGHSKDEEDIEFSLRTHISNHEVFADFQRLGAPTRDKGVHHAAEVRVWKRKAGEPAPVSVKEAGWESYAVTATPWHMAFDGTDAGMCLYIAMRWENRSVDGDENASNGKGKGKGPWSAIQCVIIP